jgi:hypothetical protein
MTMMRTLVFTVCIVGLTLFAAAQNTTPPRIASSDAKNYIGQSAMVCGKVVETKITKYGLAGHGKPVSFYIDQPETSSVFYFIAFGSKPDGPQEAVAAYEGKQICVSGQISQVSGKTFIMASDRSQIKVDTPAK